jgi:sugar (pentulose or hexulose) kinase
VYRSCARFLSPGEYLFAQIFGLGRVSCSVSMASASGLMDQTRGAWDDETLAWLPGMTPDRLSPIRDDPLRGFARGSRHAAALGPLADVPWFPAVGDGACSNLGCGATDPRRLALMIGTSGALRVVARRGERPPVPGGLWRYQADADRFLVGGALSNGGNVWAWLNETLNLPRAAADAAADEDALAVLPPDGHGLTVLPFLHGERAPGWHDDARAVIAGLSAATTPVEIARAHLEAVAYRFAAIRERLRAVAPSGEIIGTGAGLLASPVWAQILADVLGEPIAVSREEQASSRGAALLARERLGRRNVDDEAEAAAVAIDARYEPDARRGAIYAEARARHEALYRRFLGAEGPDVPRRFLTRSLRHRPAQALHQGVRPPQIDIHFTGRFPRRGDVAIAATPVNAEAARSDVPTPDEGERCTGGRCSGVVFPAMSGRASSRGTAAARCGRPLAAHRPARFPVMPSPTTLDRRRRCVFFKSRARLVPAAAGNTTRSVRRSLLTRSGDAGTLSDVSGRHRRTRRSVRWRRYPAPPRDPRLAVDLFENDRGDPGKLLDTVRQRPRMGRDPELGGPGCVDDQACERRQEVRVEAGFGLIQGEEGRGPRRQERGEQTQIAERPVGQLARLERAPDARDLEQHVEARPIRFDHQLAPVERLPHRAKQPIRVADLEIVCSAAARSRPSWSSTGVNTPTCGCRSGASSSVRNWW